MFKRIFLFIAVNLLVMFTVQLVLFGLAAMGYRIMPDSGTMGLLAFCLVWGMVGSFISLMLSKFFAKMFMGVKVINPDQPGAYNELVGIVHTLAQSAGLPKMPEVGVYESPEVNAFATGPSRSNSLVAVSSGLLNRLNRDQITAVLGHEISHVANGDMVTMTLLSGVINAFVMFFSRIVAKIVAQAIDERGRFWVEFLVYQIVWIVFALLGAVVVNYFSRRREFRADAGSAGLVGPQKMASALRALASTQNLIDPQARQSVATLKISDRPGFMRFLSTHPPLEERIARLEQMAQGMHT